MGNVLSHQLIDTGFFPVLGTTEHMRNESSVVERGTPKTWDHNMGTMVIYDEAGWPWIRPTNLSSEFYNLATTYGLRRGAHVPHSNDGGQFMRVLVALTTDGGQEDDEFNRATADYIHRGPNSGHSSRSGSSSTTHSMSGTASVFRNGRRSGPFPYRTGEAVQYTRPDRTKG